MQEDDPKHGWYLMSYQNIRAYRDFCKAACIALRHRHIHDEDGYATIEDFLLLVNEILQGQKMEPYRLLDEVLVDMRKGANHFRF